MAFGQGLLVFARGTDNAAYVKNVGVVASRNEPRWQSLGGHLTSNITPAVVQRRGPFDENDLGESALFIFERGTDNALYYNRSEESATSNRRWSGFRRLGGNVTTEASAPAFTAGNEVTLAVRGTDNWLYARTVNYDGSFSADYIGVNGVITSNPAVIHPASVRLGLDSNITELYARGSDNALLVSRLVSGRCSDYTRLGGSLG